MKRMAVIALVFCLAMVGVSASSKAMSRYQWKYRPVVVFAASGGDASLVAQKRIFAASASGLRDRHIVVVWVVGSSVAAEHGPSPGMDAASLRKRYGVAPGAFKAVLVGKDGGTKMSQSAPIGTDTLFRTIDAMPMRRDEIRGR